MVNNKIEDQVLFDGDDDLFKEILKGSKVYGEYGCGASTLWVANNTDCSILSVDSSSVWADKVLEGTCGRGGVLVSYIDLGPIGQWGYPLTYNKIENFTTYTDWIWQKDEKPDVVLIDGRFRVCCFLTTLLNADPDTYIIFDDYRDREKYHYIERFLKPILMSGRQAVFMTPEKGFVDKEKLIESIDMFRCVLD